MLKRLCAAALLAPAIALAAGSGTDTPPEPTQTTTTCTEGKIWDEASKACVDPRESRLDDDTLYDAARELAYAGRFSEAIRVLAAMSDPEDDRVLTYLGFAHRESGDVETGLDYYHRALAKNPGNLLARSYLGQAYVAMGKIDLARAELTEIRLRGGRQGWPEFSLRKAIETGRGYRY